MTPASSSALVTTGLPIPRFPYEVSLLLLQLEFADGSEAPSPPPVDSRSIPSPVLSWIEFAPISFSLACFAAPANRATRIPSPPLKAISFSSPGLVRVRSPTSIFFVSWWSAATIEMPSPPLPRSEPAALVPTRFPTTTWDSVASKWMPAPVFPPITLSSMVNVFGLSALTPSNASPSSALPRTDRPSELKPMMLPSTNDPLPMDPSMSPLIKMPGPRLPLTTFPSEAPLPPMRMSCIWEVDCTCSPSSPFAKAIRPVTSVPTRFPWMVN